jgi:hypothetical protein
VVSGNILSNLEYRANQGGAIFIMVHLRHVPYSEPSCDLLPKLLLDNPVRGLIAKNVARAMNHTDLEQIARNARALVEREFTYEAAVERYRRI